MLKQPSGAIDQAIGQVRLVSLIIWQGELYRQIISVSQALFGTFPLRIQVPFFHISYYSLTIILVSAPSSCFTLAVPMREVYCVRYTPRAWDPRSLYSLYQMLPLFFRRVAMDPQNAYSITITNTTFICTFSVCFIVICFTVYLTLVIQMKMATLRKRRVYSV